MPEPLVRLQLEALLFVANEPLGLSRLAELVEAEEPMVRQALAELGVVLTAGGLRLTEVSGEYRLVTAPEADAVVRRYLEAGARSELSRAALETLAIIAYRGPVTRAVVDEIRGVASEAMLRSLLQRGLVVERGTADEPGRPVQYAVSHTFLQHFGLSGLDELPPLPEAEARED